MAANSHETNVRCSAEAAKSFVDWYYPQINAGKSISTAYVNAHGAYDRAGHPPADITINGLRQAPKQTDPNRKLVRYDVRGWDVHVVNADYRFGAPQKLLDIHSATDGVRMMMMLTVSGTVYFGTGRNRGDDYFEKRGFQDVFVLVPNWDVLERPGAKVGRKYLVISHIYRTD